MNAHSFAAARELPRLQQSGSLSLATSRRWQARSPGWVSVQAGRAWLTRDGDCQDHVLGTGERLWLARGDVLTAEAWRPQEPTWLVWRAEPAQPWAERLLRGLVAGAAEVLARGARGLAGGLLALARSAEARACRAQGCI